MKRKKEEEEDRKVGQLPLLQDTHTSPPVCVCVCVRLRNNRHTRALDLRSSRAFFFQISSEHVPTFCSSPYKKIIIIFFFSFKFPQRLSCPHPATELRAFKSPR
ncbi:hypothetical protein OUZ56_006957 [Daphnia magna]|uniref:Uncharacterized protein n=1 Tax=Daphnia magna TaxID=35525 RepID=A0ABQ9YX72_9CRUS|nr:hypothetical protein OUZ56_006957 [Daphnia magna]